MKRFELQGIDLAVPASTAFSYIADQANLPAWAEAFAEVRGDRATMRSPAGEVEVGLQVDAQPSAGTVDWIMRFPDGSVGTAYSRVVPLDEARCAYSFVLTPPPAPLEQIEGALKEQAGILAKELDRLSRNLSDA